MIIIIIIILFLYYLKSFLFSTEAIEAANWS